MGRVPLWRRRGHDDVQEAAGSPPVTSRPRSTPIITLYDGRTVPAIMLDDGTYLTPTVKPNGEVETALAEYLTTGTSDAYSVTSQPSRTPTVSREIVVTTIYSTVGPSGTPFPVLTQTMTAASSNPYASNTINSDFSPTTSPSVFPDRGFANTDYNSGNFWDNFSQGAKAAVVIAIIIGFFGAIVACVWICCGRPRRKRVEKERESMRLDVEREMALQRSSAPPLGASVEQLGVPLRTMSTASREREEARLRDANPVMRGGLGAHSTQGSISRVASRLSRHMSLRGGGGFNDAPPLYEEVVPPAHQHLAGGIRHVNHNPTQHNPYPNGGNFGNDEEDGMGVVADGKMPLSEIPFEDVVLEQSRNEGSSSRDFERRHHMGGGDTRGHTNS